MRTMCVCLVRMNAECMKALRLNVLEYEEIEGSKNECQEGVSGKSPV